MINLAKLEPVLAGYQAYFPKHWNGTSVRTVHSGILPPASHLSFRGEGSADQVEPLRRKRCFSNQASPCHADGCHDKILILDAKYYSKTMQQQFDKATLHSANLYQIYTYVKNQDVQHSGKVSGMLVYAKTQEAITPDCMFNLGGNQIGACTLDLNQNFRRITAQLDRIAERFFGKQCIQ